MNSRRTMLQAAMTALAVQAGRKAQAAAPTPAGASVVFDS